MHFYGAALRANEIPELGRKHHPVYFALLLWEKQGHYPWTWQGQ